MLSFSVNGTFHTHLCITYPYWYTHLDWLGLLWWERQFPFLPRVIGVLYISSWRLDPKFVSLHSQKNSFFLAGNNFKISFAEWLHPLSQGKSTGPCAFRLQESLSHFIWFKWFVVSRLYLHCSSSFYIYAKYQTSLSITASWILHSILSLK